MEKRIPSLTKPRVLPKKEDTPAADGKPNQPKPKPTPKKGGRK